VCAAQVEVRAGLSLPRDAAECQAISVGEMGQIDTRASGPVELERAPRGNTPRLSAAPAGARQRGVTPSAAWRACPVPAVEGVLCVWCVHAPGVLRHNGA
jgi:hypothetical protein